MNGEEDSTPESGSESQEASGELVRESRSKTADPEQLARDTVYRLLAARARSRSELRDALRRKGIEDGTIESVLGKFDDAGLVDDSSFAESWVHQRHENQGLGRTALRAELRRKGVSDDIIAEALTHVDDDAEVARARELIRRKLPPALDTGTSGKDRDRLMRRLVSMLARKGYSEGMALRLVKEELEQSGMDGPETQAWSDTE